ncbi:unnamed protein product [Ilex paraguariensis]|uniref:Uncharacterized protein n=1 Tax=Ilex paraguariensis TaxID=185542 RepID=A0ABC8TII8_9AQUA
MSFSNDKSWTIVFFGGVMPIYQSPLDLGFDQLPWRNGKGAPLGLGCHGFVLQKQPLSAAAYIRPSPRLRTSCTDMQMHRRIMYSLAFFSFKMLLPGTGVRTCVCREEALASMDL